MHDKPVKEEMKVISMIQLYVRKWSRDASSGPVNRAILTSEWER